MLAKLFPKFCFSHFGVFPWSIMSRVLFLLPKRTFMNSTLNAFNGLSFDLIFSSDIFFLRNFLLEISFPENFLFWKFLSQKISFHWKIPFKIYWNSVFRELSAVWKFLEFSVFKNLSSMEATSFTKILKRLFIGCGQIYGIKMYIM